MSLQDIAEEFKDVKMEQTVPSTGPFNHADFYAQHGITVFSSKPHNGGTMHFVECFDKSQHSGDSGKSEAATFEYPDGRNGFKCQHAHCVNFTWSDFRNYYEPGYKAKWTQYEEILNRKSKQEQQSSNTTSQRTPIIKSLAEYEREPVEGIFYNYLYRGAITMLDGDPEVGKSWVYMSLGAAFSMGSVLPTGERVPQGNVIIMSVEDDPGKVMKTRIENSFEANQQAIFPVTYFREGDEEKLITMRDIEMLQQTIKLTRPIALFVDPLIALEGKGNPNDGKHAREILTPLKKVVAENNMFFLATGHLAKDEDRKAIYRGSGSIQYQATVRSKLAVGYDYRTKDKTNRLLGQIKNSWGKRHFGVWEFQVDDAGIFHWGEFIPDIDPDSILMPPKETRSKSNREINEIINKHLPHVGDVCLKSVIVNEVFEKKLGTVVWVEKVKKDRGDIESRVIREKGVIKDAEWKRVR